MCIRDSNSEAWGWGAGMPNRDKNVVEVDMPVATAKAPSEQFTISFAGTPTAATMELTWDSTLVSVPIAAG